jgi:hypothetical protein
MRDSIAAGAVVGRDRQRALDVAAGRRPRATSAEVDDRIRDAAGAPGGGPAPKERVDARALAEGLDVGPGMLDLVQRALDGEPIGGTGKNPSPRQIADVVDQHARSQSDSTAIRFGNWDGQTILGGERDPEDREQMRRDWEAGMARVQAYRDLAERLRGVRRRSADAPARKSAARKMAAPKAGPDAHVAAIRGLTTSDEVAAYLDAHPMTAAQMREVARGLGPTVALFGRTKPEIRQAIIDGTTGFRERSEVILPGGWRGVSSQSDVSGGPDIKAVAEQVRAAGATRDEDPRVHLEGLTVPQLRAVAREMDLTLLPGDKNYIRRQIAGFAAGWRQTDPELSLAGGSQVFAPGPVELAGRAAARSAVERMTGTRGRARGGPDPRDVAVEVAAQPTEADMIRLLAGDQQLTAARLRKVADELGIEVPPAMRAKTALQLHIADAVARRRGLPPAAAASPAAARMTGTRGRARKTLREGDVVEWTPIGGEPVRGEVVRSVVGCSCNGRAVDRSQPASCEPTRSPRSGRCASFSRPTPPRLRRRRG